MNESKASDWRQRPENTAQAFDSAVAHHRAGRLDEAERLYRAVLASEPEHFGALHHLGLVVLNRGKLEDAEALLRRAVAADPKSVQALCNLGAALTQLRRFDEAIAVGEKALAIDPSSIEAHNLLGVVLQLLGRFEQAAAQFGAALRRRPGNAALHNNLGISLAALGRMPEAVAAYEKAIAIEPRYAEAQKNLGDAFAALGRRDEALVRLYRALDLAPESAETHNALAAVLLAAKAYDEAIVHCWRAIAIKPEFAEAHNNLGLVLASLRRHGEAIEHYRRAIALKPDLAKAHSNLGNALTALRRHGEAVAHYRRALEIKPDFAEARGNLAMALTELSRHDEAMRCYERALAIAPDLAEVRAGYGNQLAILGRLDEARQESERAVALAPSNPKLYANLGRVKRFKIGDPELAAMHRLAGNMSALSSDERLDLHFALGKAYADIGRHDGAFRHVKAGNALKRRQIAYDEAATLGLLERIAATFTRDVMARLAGSGDSSELPIFIVGMPRSGTTLVEQVLASHPLVFGGGELSRLEAAINAVLGADGVQSLPERIGTMSADDVRRVGTHYRDAVAALAPQAQRITDKMPLNFRFVGLIHLALPNARVVHMQRNPADTCLSCFSKQFAGDLSFAYDLAELGRYYRAYARLMAHWRAVLPDGAMLDVQYEDLVTDFSTQARRLIAYCGLPWDERCVAFHKTDRPVTTMSAAQVRRPIYRDAVGAWVPYKEMLKPLLNELGIET